MYEIFFSLIRAGLWGTSPDTSLFSGMTPARWQQLYRLASTQSLLSVFFDGINTLPPNLYPPRNLYLQLAAQTLQIEQANDRLNRMVGRLNSLYAASGLHPVLLKGQGMAFYYRNPRHRQCGDIDIYLGEEGQTVANSVLLEAGAVSASEESDKHASYEWDGVQIENHRLVSRMGNPLANHRFMRLVREWYPDGAEHIIDMPTPPPTFNALYIFLHAFEHFLGGGIGLRQLCDWSCFFYRRAADIDIPRLRRDLHRLGLYRAACAFGYVAVSYLGLKPEYFPFDTSSSRHLGEELIKEIFATGNFGKYDTRNSPRPKGYWRGKWHTFSIALRRISRLYHYAPQEALFYPVALIKNVIITQSKLLKKRFKP